MELRILVLSEHIQIQILPFTGAILMKDPQFEGVWRATFPHH